MLQSTALLQRIKTFAGMFSTRVERQRAHEAWSYYWRLYERRYGSLVAAVIAGVAQSFALVPIPLMVGYIIDHAVPARNTRLVLLASSGIFVSLLAYSTLIFLTRHFAAKANASAVCRLRRELLAQWFRLSRSYLSRADHGKLHANFVLDSERVVLMGTVLIENFLPASLTCLALCAFFLWLNAPILLVLAVVAPLLLLSIRSWEGKVRESVNNFRSASKDFSHGATRLLRSIDLIRHQGADQFEFDHQKGFVERLHRDTLALAWANARYNWAQSIIIAFAMLLVLALSGLAVVTGRMTLGQLLALYAGFALLRDRLYTLLQTIPPLVAGNESLIAMWDVLQNQDRQPYNGTQQLNFAGEVKFTNVNFGYDETDLIRDVVLALGPASSTAITGPNAAGKTTLVHLLLGFYKTRSGAIEIDGVPIEKIDLPHLRRQIGVVPQDPLIPSASVAEIISYGFPDATLKEIKDAARSAGLEVFIKDLPDGYHTQVGENGILLSGGQRQRLAIARALLGQPKLLILDEPTNHLDPAAVGELMATLRELPSQPAMLLITHSVELARLTDYVYVMDNGQIVTEGPASEVLHGDKLPEHFLWSLEGPEESSADRVQLKS